MLILSRRIGEMIMIGDDITVTVLAIKGGQARLGIGAPKKVEVHREEVYQRKKAAALDVKEARLDRGGATEAAA